VGKGAGKHCLIVGGYGAVPTRTVQHAETLLVGTALRAFAHPTKL
jgi:hypothetical protein